MKKQSKTLALSKQAQLGLLLSAALTMSTGAYAGAVTIGVLPTAPNTQFGSANYSLDLAGVPSDGTGGKVNTIKQTTPHLITNWQSFSIGSGLTVNLDQAYTPGLQGTALFRVVGNAASDIFGTLSATGTLFLVNNNGVLFNKGSQVNAGNFVASSMNMTDDNFKLGNYIFSNAEGTPRKTVVNNGSIERKGGYVVLLSDQKVENNGNIEAGSVVLATAQEAELMFDNRGLVTAKLTASQLQELQTTNAGNINASNGSVQLAASGIGAAVNVAGLITASQMTSDAGGVIHLQATGKGSNVVDRSGNRTTLKTRGGVNIIIEADSDVKLSNTVIETTGATVLGLGGNVKGGNAGDITITAGGNVSVGNVLSEGGHGMGALPPKPPPGAVKALVAEAAPNNTNGGNGGAIVIVAGGDINAKKVDSVGGNAAGASTTRFNPFQTGEEVASVAVESVSVTIGGGNGGNGGHIALAAGNNATLGIVTSGGGNGHLQEVSEANGGHGGNVGVSAGNNVKIEVGAASGGGFGGAGKAKDEVTTLGGNAGNVNIKAGQNAELGLIASIGGTSGGNGDSLAPTTAGGGNAGDVNVEAGGAVTALGLISQGGRPGKNEAKGSDAGNVNVASTAKGDINIAFIMANSGNEVGSQFGKWGKAGTAAKSGNVSVSNADGGINVAYIDTQGGANADGGNVTVKGANDVVLGGKVPKPAQDWIRENALSEGFDLSTGGINTNGGGANFGELSINQLDQKQPQGTSGNNAGNIDVTANGDLSVGKVTANGSDASGRAPTIKSEGEAAAYAEQAPKLNGGNGGTVTLRYGNAVSFIEPSLDADVHVVKSFSLFGGPTRPSLPIIKNPNPMHGPDGLIANVPEGQITANGGLPTYYGFYEPVENKGDNTNVKTLRQAVISPTYRTLGAFGTPGQISILKLVDPAVITPAVTTPVTPVTPGIPGIPNARNSAGLGGFIGSLPGVLTVNVQNVGATASGGEEGEEEEEGGGSSNPNSVTVLNFGASKPAGVD